MSKRNRGHQVASRKKASRDASHKVEKGIKKVQRLTVRTWRRFKLAESNFRRRFEGLPEIMQFNIPDPIRVRDVVEVKAFMNDEGFLTAKAIKKASSEHFDEGIRFIGRVKVKHSDQWLISGIKVLITPETKTEEVQDSAVIDKARDIDFLVFRPDELPWDHIDLDRNLNLLKDLLYGSPLKFIQLWYKPRVAESSEMDDYIVEAIAKAKSRKVYSEHMLLDLTEAKEYMLEKIIGEVKFAVYAPGYLREKDRKPLLDKLTLTSREARELTAMLLHGAWNRTEWDRVEQEWEDLAKEGIRSRSVINAITPLKLFFHPEGLTIEGIGENKTYFRSIRTKGLGLRLLDPRNPRSPVLLNTRSWLSGFLPFAIENPDEMVVLQTTYYIPDEPDESEEKRFKTGEYFQLREELDAIDDLVDQENKEQETEKRILKDSERNVLAGYDMAMKDIHDKDDTRVRATYKIGVAAADKTLARKLKQRVQNRLTGNAVLTLDVRGRPDQLEDIRSLTLPIVPEEDVLINTSPIGLKYITVDSKPDEEMLIPEGRLKLFVGQYYSREKLGRPKFWPVDRSFICLGGQGSGKSALGKILTARGHHQFPHKSAFFWYSGTNTRRPDSYTGIDWPALDRYINAGRLPNSQGGILYAEDYRTPDELYSALMRLVEAGARLIVFQAMDKVEAQYKIGIGFAHAFEEYMVEGIPCILGVDEIGKIAKSPLLAEEFGEIIAPDITKKTTLMMGFGHTTLGLDEQVRKTWIANVDRIIFGQTPLLRDVPEEANILVELFPEVAREVSQTIIELKKKGIPGIMVETGAGGGIAEVWQTLAIYKLFFNFILRKPPDFAEEYGV